MDASLRLWFGDREGLHVAVGDATRMIIGAYFDHKETQRILQYFQPDSEEAWRPIYVLY
jgi:hypothetical protein